VAPNIILDPHMTTSMSTKDVLVPRPRPTSSPHVLAPDGQARAEGVVAILVARLSDAVRNNDHIMPVIRSTCPSSDDRNTGRGSVGSRSCCQRLWRVWRSVYWLGVSSGIPYLSLLSWYRGGSTPQHYTCWEMIGRQLTPFPWPD
jgi:hypothetical protein